MLKYKETRHFVVQVNDLDAFVEESYGRPYSFTAAEWCANDTEHAYTVDGEYDEYGEDRIGRWMVGETDGHPPARFILNDLAQRDMIPKGEYLIEVCW